MYFHNIYNAMKRMLYEVRIKTPNSPGIRRKTVISHAEFYQIRSLRVWLEPRYKH